MKIEKAIRDLASTHYSFIPSEDWTLHRAHPQEWKDFSESWDRLVIDHYMRTGDSFRERRFCKYVVDTPTMSFTELDDFSFYQSPSINSYAGGLHREFFPVEPAIRKSAILLEIIRTCLAAILRCGAGPSPSWNVYVHQFRIKCDNAITGQPTPEGLHRDGHDFISMHLMDRSKIEGGVSTICGEDRQPLMQATLQNRMDSFLLNDRALLHGVSPIAPVTDDAGHRDMLIIDYNRNSQ